MLGRLSRLFPAVGAQHGYVSPGVYVRYACPPEVSVSHEPDQHPVLVALPARPQERSWSRSFRSSLDW